MVTKLMFFGIAYNIFKSDENLFLMSVLSYTGNHILSSYLKTFQLFMKSSEYLLLNV